ncbi:MAG: hypothetical protein LM583_01065 [Desulfurococcaceae archaeon]|nr:hypothetical protein [Desulfurococcaceae archaeon]
MKPYSNPRCGDVYQCLKEAYSVNLDVQDRLAEILIAMEYYGIDSEELVLRIKDLVPDLYKLVRYVLEVVRILNNST